MDTAPPTRRGFTLDRLIALGRGGPARSPDELFAEACIHGREPLPGPRIDPPRRPHLPYVVALVRGLAALMHLALLEESDQLAPIARPGGGRSRREAVERR